MLGQLRCDSLSWLLLLLVRRWSDGWKGWMKLCSCCSQRALLSSTRNKARSASRELSTKELKPEKIQYSEKRFPPTEDSTSSTYVCFRQRTSWPSMFAYPPALQRGKKKDAVWRNRTSVCSAQVHQPIQTKSTTSRNNHYTKTAAWHSDRKLVFIDTCPKVGDKAWLHVLTLSCSLPLNQTSDKVAMNGDDQCLMMAAASKRSFFDNKDLNTLGCYRYKG